MFPGARDQGARPADAQAGFGEARLVVLFVVLYCCGEAVGGGYAASGHASCTMVGNALPLQSARDAASVGAGIHGSHSVGAGSTYTKTPMRQSDLNCALSSRNRNFTSRSGQSVPGR